MISKRQITLASGAGAAVALTCFALLASGSSAAEYVPATPLLAYDLSATVPGQAPAAQQPASVQPTVADDSAAQAGPVLADVDAKSVECMAKVVLHEAANQPREGKIAVAQTLVNRLKAGGIVRRREGLSADLKHGGERAVLELCRAINDVCRWYEYFWISAIPRPVSEI